MYSNQLGPSTWQSRASRQSIQFRRVHTDHIFFLAALLSCAMLYMLTDGPWTAAFQPNAISQAVKLPMLASL